jgi:hypothetical protein
MASTETPAPPLRREERRRVVAKYLFVLAGTLSFLLSVGLWFLGDDRETAIFVGLWVPSLFSLGALIASPERVPATRHDELERDR